MKISVVMPICAWPVPQELGGAPHPFLRHSLDSILGGNHGDIEILAGIDGAAPRVKAAVQGWARDRGVGPDAIRVHEFPFSGTYGNRQRNLLLAMATGDLICFQDQDDCFCEGALKGVNRIAQEHPGRPLIFKMQVYCHGDHANPHNPPLVYWNQKGLVEHSLVGGHMLVVPNEKSRLGTWREDDYAGDFYFIRETLDNFSQSGIDAHWSEVFISKLRPWAVHA